MHSSLDSPIYRYCAQYFSNVYSICIISNETVVFFERNIRFEQFLFVSFLFFLPNSLKMHTINFGDSFEFSSMLHKMCTVFAFACREKTPAMNWLKPVQPIEYSHKSKMKEHLFRNLLKWEISPFDFIALYSNWNISQSKLLGTWTFFKIQSPSLGLIRNKIKLNGTIIRTMESMISNIRFKERFIFKYLSIFRWIYAIYFHLIHLVIFIANRCSQWIQAIAISDENILNHFI